MNEFELVQEELNCCADESDREVDDLKNSCNFNGVHLLIKMFILPDLFKKILFHSPQEKL